MDDKEKSTAQTATATNPLAQTTAASIAYNSNPFTTTLRGIKKVFHYNTNSLIATMLFTIVIAGLIAVAVITMAAAFVAFMLQNNWKETATLVANLPPEAIEFAHSMSIGGIYASWAIGLALVIFLGTLLQTIQFKLVTASANTQVLGFGELLKQSMRRVLPLLGLAGVIIGISITALIVLVLVGQITGPIIVVLAIIAMILMAYFGVRLSLAPFAILEENLSPIAGIRRSLSLSAGHFMEILGIIAATTVLILIPTIILDAIGNALSGPGGDMVQLVSLIANLIVSTIVVVGFAERYLQLRAVKEGSLAAVKTHPANYLAILVALFALGASYNVNQTNPYYNPMQSDQYIQENRHNDDSDLDNYNVEKSTEPAYNLN